MPNLTEIREAFERALEQNAAGRSALLAALSPEMRSEVETLLAAHESMGSFLAGSEEGMAPGDRLGPYRIVERIGAGGMGTVYRACRDDGEFQREVAIKLVGSRFFAPEANRRFIEERRILAALDHPNIVRMIDGGIAAGRRYLVMEFVSGKPVTEHCTGLPARERLRIFQTICAAMQYAHQHLIIHRDLKPANILVTTEGQVKVLDFGIARLLGRDLDGTTTLGHPMTPDYASPEQVRGLAPGIASDIYSLGVLLHELLTGRRPYRLTGKPLDEVLATVCDREIDRPRTGSAELDAIVLRALRKEPEWRYPSVEQFAADVERWLQGRPVAAVTGSWLYLARKFVRRRWIPLATAGAVAMALAGGAVSTLIESRRTAHRFSELRGLAHSLLFEIYDSISMTPGSLATRRLVAGRARQYLDSLARDAGKDPALARDLAESYVRLGDVLGSPYIANLGDTSGAFESYDHAVALLNRDTAQHPNDIEVRERLADAQIKLSRVLQRRGDAVGAVQAGRKAIDLLESVPAPDPARGEKLSRMYVILAEAQSLAAGDSIPALQQGLATSEKSRQVLGAGGARPDENWRHAYVASSFRIGYALYILGERTRDRSYYQKALGYQLEGHGMLRALAAEHPERTYEREMADEILTIAVTRWKGSHAFAISLRDIEQARDTFRRLADRDPQNLELKRDLANSWAALGMIQGESGIRDRALRAEREALTIYRDLEHADPASAENAKAIAQESSRIANLEGVAGR